MYYCAICKKKFKRLFRRNKHIQLHNRQIEYTNIIKQIKKPKHTNLIFKEKGKLIFCLIEFRNMKEIEYVTNSILKVYDPSEIGLAFVYGNGNKDYIDKITANMKNILHIKFNFENIGIKQYNKILKSKIFYDKFSDWDFMCLIQTDALIVRKIDDIYFNYDYIGAPRSLTHPGGNGGFSLRNISKFRELTKVNTEFNKIN